MTTAGRSVVRMVRQAGGLSIGRIAAASISLAWFAIASRLLPVPVFGDLALLLSVGAIMAIVADGGMALVLNEVVAREPGTGRSSLLLVLRRRLALSFAAVAGTVAAYSAAADDRSLLIPLVFGISILATSAYTSGTAALRGLGAVAPDVANEVGSRLAVLGCGWLLLENGAGLMAVVVVYAFVDLCSAVILTSVAWRRLNGREPVDPTVFQGRRLILVALAGVVGLAYYRIDVWLLGLLSVSRDVAEYAMSVKVIDAVMIPAGAVALVAAGGTAHQGFREARANVDRLAALLAAGVTLVAAGLWIWADVVITTAFGSTYLGAAASLRILAIAAIPAAAALAWSPLIVLRGSGFLQVSATALASNVALNMVLIPAHRSRGAAVATLICQVGYAAAIRFKLRGEGRADGRE